MNKRRVHAREQRPLWPAYIGVAVLAVVTITIVYMALTRR